MKKHVAMTSHFPKYESEKKRVREREGSARACQLFYSDLLRTLLICSRVDFDKIACYHGKV